MNGRVRVVIDFASPASWLAVDPTRALESSLAETFVWLPLRAATIPKPPPAGSSDDRTTRHRRFRAEYVVQDLRRYAQARGLELGDVDREVDTTEASMGLLWLNRSPPSRAGSFVSSVFGRVWQDHAAAGRDFVEDALGEAAGGYRLYAATEGPREVAAAREELIARSVWSTPAYLLEEDLFIGRQHLPMVRWILTGRDGPPPI